MIASADVGMRTFDNLSVHSAGITESLQKLYTAPALVKELLGQ